MATVVQTKAAAIKIRIIFAPYDLEWEWAVLGNAVVVRQQRYGACETKESGFSPRLLERLPYGPGVRWPAPAGERGKPVVLQLAYAAYLDSGAEAVVCIANREVTGQVVHGLERRGIPAFGPIWDS